MEQERRDCGSCFPHQGPHEGHGIRFYLHRYTFSFYVGEGSAGEVNEISGDGLELEDQLILIHQFFKNPQLKRLRLYCKWNPVVTLVDKNDVLTDDTTYTPAVIAANTNHALPVWTEIMRELQHSTSLEYLEFAIGDDERMLSDGWELPLKEMLTGNSSLLGLKTEVFNTTQKCEDIVLEAISKNKTLPLLHVNYSIWSSNGWKALMASLTPNSSGYQTNTCLRTLQVVIGLPFFRGPTEATLVSMLESNTTLTRVIIPYFGGSSSYIIKALKALERNQSVTSVIVGDGKGFLVHCEEFSTKDVFYAILKLINFRRVHGYALTMVDVQGSLLDKPEYVNPIQDALKRKPFTNATCSDLFVQPTLCRVFLCGFPEAGKTTLRKN